MVKLHCEIYHPMEVSALPVLINNGLWAGNIFIVPNHWYGCNIIQSSVLKMRVLMHEEKYKICLGVISSRGSRNYLSERWDNFIIVSMSCFTFEPRFNTSYTYDLRYFVNHLFLFFFSFSIQIASNRLPNNG